MERRVCEGSERGIRDRGVKPGCIDIEALAYHLGNRLGRFENPLRPVG